VFFHKGRGRASAHGDALALFRAVSERRADITRELPDRRAARRAAVATAFPRLNKPFKRNSVQGSKTVSGGFVQRGFKSVPPSAFSIDRVQTGR
jgi:hypothetical protein